MCCKINTAIHVTTKHTQEKESDETKLQTLRTESSNRANHHPYPTAHHVLARDRGGVKRLSKPLHRSDESFLFHVLLGLGREVRVDSIRRSATLVDRPHDQRLAPAAVTRRKHTFRVGAVVPVRCVDVLALVDWYSTGRGRGGETRRRVADIVSTPSQDTTLGYQNRGHTCRR